MIRQAGRWVVLGVCFALAWSATGSALAEPEREERRREDRERAEREERRRAEPRRGDRERAEHEERLREERKRAEHEERRREEQEHRERAEREGWRREERPREEREHREREREQRERENREHRRGGERPQVHVIRLNHIPAESIMEVLEQLMRAPHFREAMEQIPVAVNGPANAVVVIGPPEVMELFHQIVEPLDQPSEFHERMRERQMDEMRREMEMHKMRLHVERGPQPDVRRQMEMRKQADIRKQMEMRKQAEMRRQMEMRKRGRSPGGPPRAAAPPRPQPPRGGPPRKDLPRQPERLRAAPPRRPDRPRAEGGPPGADRIVETLLAPASRIIKPLLNPEVARKLRLDDRQHAAIREIAEDHKRQAVQAAQRVAAALRGRGPGTEQQADRARQMLKEVHKVFAQKAEQLHDRIAKVLRPEQREAAMRLLHPKHAEDRDDDREHKRRDRDDDREHRGEHRDRDEDRHDR